LLFGKYIRLDLHSTALTEVTELNEGETTSLHKETSFLPSEKAGGMNLRIVPTLKKKLNSMV
jgi:hypothetical protein